MNINFPYQVRVNGRTDTTDRSDHIRDMIKQVLFTSPGERVNRPTFGCGLNQLVFEPNSLELISTLQFLVKGALLEWLSEEIEVEEVRIEILDSTLQVQIQYSEIGMTAIMEAVFERVY
ncbi:GPW/gp25 family protein [Lunatibacter salilacus]|uniref:GPW/gp25 family protein n=1 Tax=Lunatibacter salilacus TaxID=2483804 RepID=UPI00131D0529|nr:GPW/gp25 family protein [Lunatibacter salilacus]